MQIQVARVTPLPRKEVIYVARKKELTKADRINAEERLRTIYKNIDKDNKQLLTLIQRATYMRVALEDYERDLTKRDMLRCSLNRQAHRRMKGKGLLQDYIIP